jgi:hypothetical protein
MPEPMKCLISTIRERIETVFSQLWARFIDRIQSWSWCDLWNTVTLKLLRYTYRMPRPDSAPTPVRTALTLFSPLMFRVAAEPFWCISNHSRRLQKAFREAGHRIENQPFHVAHQY